MDDAVIVGRVDDIPPGCRKFVKIGGREYAIFNIGGDFFAVANVCPHEGGPVCTGELWGYLTAEILPNGEVREFYASQGDVLACPWHGWEYDVRTGQCLGDRKRRLSTLPTHVRDGMVVVTPRQPRQEA